MEDTIRVQEKYNVNNSGYKLDNYIRDTCGVE